MRTGVLLAMSGLALAASCAAQQAELFETKTSAVAIYTDGLSYFVREGTGSPRDGWAMTNFVPKAVSGSLRVIPENAVVRVDSLIATARNDIPFTDEKSLGAALQPYVGVRVRLEWDGGSAEGKLEFLLPDMAVLTEGKRSFAVRYGQVMKAQILGYPLRILFELPPGTRSVPLRMGYLQEGLSWQGSYEFEILSDSEAGLAYRATVVNGAEDLVDCDTTFVLGTPPVAMRGVLDPMATSVRVPGTFTREEIELMQYDVSDTSVLGKGRESFGGLLREEGKAGGAGYFRAKIPAGEGHVNFSEFHFFRKPGLSLRQGDVGQISLFEEAVTYRSEFEWDTASGEVWHYTRVKNTSKQPWPAGPVLALRGGRSLGQGMMEFTPPGADATLAAAPVTDVTGKTAEREVERLPERTFGQSTYVPVKLQGTLTINNLRAEEIRLNVTHRVDGAELEVSDGGRVETVEGEQINVKHTIVWEVGIPAKTGSTLSYTYTRYVLAGNK
jgi:hypothetical protein